MDARWVRIDGGWELRREGTLLGTVRRYEHGRGWRVRVPGLSWRRANLPAELREVVFCEGYDRDVTYPGVVNTKADAAKVIEGCRWVMAVHGMA